MKKIAIITGEALPVPASKGGAVESLINYIINENEHTNTMNITIISVFDKKAEEASKKYNNTNFFFIKLKSHEIRLDHIFRRILGLINNNKLKNSNLYINKVLKKYNLDNYDAVIVENRPNFVIPIYRKIKGKIILHIHNDYLNKDIPNSKDILEKCHSVITVSNYIKKRVLSLGDKYENKVHVLHNCTDTRIFNIDNYKLLRYKLRKNYNILPNETVIMYSGRIDETKGIKELILAFKEIENKETKLIIIGGTWYGSNRKTDYFRELEDISSEIKDRIIITGFIPFTDIPKYHAIADIAVVPSIWEEPAGLVVIEAMASGLPLIVTDSGGILEYVNEESVIVINRNKDIVNELSKQISFLINDKEKRIELARIGKRYAQTFNTKKYYDEFSKIVGDLINE